ncbi:MAG: MBL fold metallo-hydrolase [Candidatus Asgardarchaeia archaeon]
MKYIKVEPIAAESLGVRSMATYVKTADVKLLIDPGMKLGVRYKLPPHPIEYRLLKDSFKKLLEYTHDSEIVIITHFHTDHFTPFFENYVFRANNKEDAILLYSDKKVIFRRPEEITDPKQKRAAMYFYRDCSKIAEVIELSEGKVLEIGNTIIQISPPLPHGGMNRGYVNLVSVMYDVEKFLFVPDAFSPIHHTTLNYVIEERPNLLYLSGPPTYILSRRRLLHELRISVENLKKIIKACNACILDHHLLRDPNWLFWMYEIMDLSIKLKRKVETVAEFIGKKVNNLEARRRELWNENPPDNKFIRWSELEMSIKKHYPPFSI